MLDYLAIGHIAQDITPNGIRLGGTVAYAALTAHALGLRTGVVTAAAPGAVTDGLERLTLHCLPSPRSTTFENKYGPNGRTQTLHAQAGPLTFDSVPAEWRAAPIVHLAPIAREVDADLANRFSSALVCLTPQGWMRQWDGAGRVSKSKWESAESALKSATATVISIEDVSGDRDLIEHWAGIANIFVVTEGGNGATVFQRGSRYHVPAPAVAEVDATGAGDIFAASFFVRFWQTRNVLESARFAVALASDSITRVGIDGVPKQDSISNTQY
ncbi:MAG: ribokinase [Chloroflexi bacterium]|nr:ribokinase [Chloroflexota bacterium]